MKSEVFSYPMIIKENHLDTFGHVNNATYLMLFEEARWELLNKNGFGLRKIQEGGVGPTILEINLKFLKELRLREEIIIQTQLISYQEKIGTLAQRILRADEVCCEAIIIMGLFSLKERKLILPTPEWLNAVGINT